MEVRMQSTWCGKVVHFTAKSAEEQADSLKERYGTTPNIYICEVCSTESRNVWHVGYGYRENKLSKRARRHRNFNKKRKREKREGT